MDIDDIEYQDKIGGEITHKDKIHIVAMEIEKHRDQMEQKKSAMNQKICIAQFIDTDEAEEETAADDLMNEAEEIRKEGLKHKVKMEELEEMMRKYVREQYYNL